MDDTHFCSDDRIFAFAGLIHIQLLFSKEDSHYWWWSCDNAVGDRGLVGGQIEGKGCIVESFVCCRFMNSLVFAANSRSLNPRPVDLYSIWLRIRQHRLDHKVGQQRKTARLLPGVRWKVCAAERESDVCEGLMILKVKRMAVKANSERSILELGCMS